jgi:hypothetical protein
VKGALRLERWEPAPAKGISEFVDIFLRKREAGAMILGDAKLDRRSNRLARSLGREKGEKLFETHNPARELRRRRIFLFFCS